MVLWADFTPDNDWDDEMDATAADEDPTDIILDIPHAQCCVCDKDMDQLEAAAGYGYAPDHELEPPEFFCKECFKNLNCHQCLHPLM